MSHHRYSRTLAFFAAALIGVGVPAVTAAPAASAEPEQLSVTDFEDGGLGDWQQSGSPTTSVVEADGGQVLLVENRAQDFDGIQSDPGLLAGLSAGVDYTVSMRARLADGVAGSVPIRFVLKPAYSWVGATTVTADAWTTVTGTFTVPADGDPAARQFYIGTGDSSAAAPYSYLVDDIVISTAATDPVDPDDGFVGGGAVSPVSTPVSAAQGTGQVSALTFDDGPNGETTAALLDFLADNDITATFCVIGQNIEAPGGAELLRRMVAEGHVLCNHSTDYADMGSLTAAQAETRMKQNLAIIRDALGDPQAKVPFFRAPNGSWGATQQVAVDLGMQPLAVTNTISDWETQDVPTLTAALRTAMRPGEVVLTHDGGGDRAGTLAAIRTVVSERIADGWTFTLPAGVTSPGPGTGAGVSTDFESGLDGWGPRDSGSGAPVVTISDEAHGGQQSALVSGRTSQGSGIAVDATGSLTPGTPYELTAWVKFAAGEPADAIWLSLGRTTGSATAFDTLGQFAGISNGEWTQVRAAFTPSTFDTAQLYLETAYSGTNTSDFPIDDIVLTAADAPQVQDITPIRDTVDFPAGVAIDSRETTGAAAELVTRHFDQVTSENYMKPEAWYDDAGNFRSNPEADALMVFAQQNDLDVYGHTLVWHSQTPAWFFDAADGTDLTDSAQDQQILRDRMRTHIFSVAEHLSATYGRFGSAENPLTAFDVVNEVISDQSTYEDGMRRSEWYRILGEGFVDLAFEYADEAFNEEFAAPGVEQPVTLFMNDYNTEQDGKQQRFRALVERLLARGVPIGGVGHQFHVSLATPVDSLEAAIVRFEDLPLRQAVTELDVTTGVPETEASLIEQGYFYRDAFRIFREHAESIFSVTLWGLTDGRSWRADSGAPLVFDDGLQAKPAYYGVVDGELPPRQRSANVFAGDIPLDADATTAPDWDRLPLADIEGTAGFQLKWAPDHLTAYVSVDDPTVEEADSVEFELDGGIGIVDRDGSGDFTAVVTERSGGYDIVAHLPASLSEGTTVTLDVRVRNGSAVVGWNTPGALGTLTLIEELSYLEVNRANTGLLIDGEVDGAWADATSVSTAKQVEGADGASAEFRTLWNDQTLYVLAEVTDPVVDVSGSDPWIQDSVEIFVDPGNRKNGAYRYDDTQIRISAENVVSVGTGDEAFQLGRLTSATRQVEGGYVVEAAISLLEDGGENTFHGLDFQVNDASAGARTSIRNWADPSALGYQSTARWGVGQLVAAAAVDPGTDPGGPGDGTGAGAGSGQGGSGQNGSGQNGSGATGGLAATGAAPLALLGLAIALLALGAATTAVRRRRPSEYTR